MVVDDATTKTVEGEADEREQGVRRTPRPIFPRVLRSRIPGERQVRQILQHIHTKTKTKKSKKKLIERAASNRPFVKNRAPPSPRRNRAVRPDFGVGGYGSLGTGRVLGCTPGCNHPSPLRKSNPWWITRRCPPRIWTSQARLAVSIRCRSHRGEACRSSGATWTWSPMRTRRTRTPAGAASPCEDRVSLGAPRDRSWRREERTSG